MIEAPEWSLRKDETIHKAASAAHLRKYGQFFEDLAGRYGQESSNLEYLVEGPIRLTLKVDEDISLFSLAETENKIFSKLLASVAGTCREIRLLKAESRNFFDKLFSHGEQCIDNSTYRVESLLPDVQDLSVYSNRVLNVIHLTVSQLSSLASNAHREFYLPLLIEHLLDLLLIFITIDEIAGSQTALVEQWKAYRVRVRSVIHNSSQLNIPEQKILLYEKLLKDLHLQLLSKNLFNRAIEHVMNIGKTTTMSDHMVCFLKNAVSDVENKILDNAAINRNWILANVGVVVHAKFFGSADRRLLKRIVEVNKKLYAVSLVGNVVWRPNDFLMAHLPKDGIAALPTQLGEKILTARVQRLPAVANNLIQRAMMWCIEMQTLLMRSGQQVFAEIERKRSLLLEVLNVLRQIRENVSFTTNLHALLLKPMSRTTVQLICRLVEAQKCLETAFHALSGSVVLSQAQVLQQLTYQALSVLEGVRRAMHAQLQTRGGSKGRSGRDRLESLSLIRSSLRLAAGAPSADRRLLLRCGLVCASQLSESFREEELVKLRACLDSLDTLTELHELVDEACDYSVLLQHQSMLPAYLSLVAEGGCSAGHLGRLLAALGDALPPSEGRLAEQRKMLERNVLEVACREIETSLRLHVHAHLKLDSTNPFEIGARDGARFVRAAPLTLGGRLLSVKRFVEHYLDATFYNLTTVALHDWRTYGTMHALAGHKLGLDTVHSSLPTQTLEQGLDALEVMRNIHVFVARYQYNLHTQTFVERTSASKHLNTIGIRHVANSIRTHGTGIMSTTVNFVYQFLRAKLHAFSQFLFDEHIKSRLMRDARHIRAQRESPGGGPPYSYERADKFQRGIRKLGMTREGLSYLDQFRQLVAHIGNALGYVRLIRSGGLHASSEAVSFLPDIGGRIGELAALLDADEQLRGGLGEQSQSAARRLDQDVADLVRNFTEGIHYFKLLVDVFAPAFRDASGKCHHLQQFYAIVPPLTLSFVDNALSNKEKLFKKNSVGAAFSDDGFAVGVAYVNALLGQSAELDGLKWFDTVSEHLASERAAAEARAEHDDEKLRQTRALTLKRIEDRSAEFRLLYYSLSGARVFFEPPEA